MKGIILLHILLLYHLANAQTKADYHPARAKVDSLIHLQMKEKNISGLSLAVIENGKTVLAKGYGFSNLEHSIAASEQTVYCIASITKTFTAMATMMLVEAGKISLDAPISLYLSGLPATWKGITIRQLLNHTSGISSFSVHTKIPCPVGKDVRDYHRGDVLKEVACLPLDFPPGERWAYGDTGYYLLGMLIEHITGKSYEEFLRERIFSPLGMDKTRLISYTELIPGRADGHDYQNGAYKLAPRFEVDEFANGGLVSTVMDMARLHTAFTSEILLRKSTWDQMWTNARLTSGEMVTAYGLGFGLTPFQGRRRVGHNGGGGLGFSTALTHFPAEKITVVVLANANQAEGSIGKLANTIASFYFK
jgi:CubicO group peptidase (beta-lactamase class C family)